MSSRTFLCVTAALLGIAATAAVAWSASQLAGQHVGLSAEPLSVARGLAPATLSAAHHARGPGERRPAGTQSGGAAPTTVASAPTVPTIPTAVTPPASAPVTPPAPTTAAPTSVASAPRPAGPTASIATASPTPSRHPGSSGQPDDSGGGGRDD